MEWLFAHPEEPTAAAASAANAAPASSEGDEQQLAQALAASLHAGDPSKDAPVRCALNLRFD